MRAVLKFVVSAAFLALGIGSAPAVEVGSPAWTRTGLIMYEGPGREYSVVGEAVGQARIAVDRCSGQWCLIRTGYNRGWVDRYKLSFGREPWPPYYVPMPGWGEGGPGQVCLYEGYNFTGAALCATSGYAARDLLLLHRDNVYSSVSVEGDVSVTLCRDRDYKSYCDRVTSSEASLHGFLDNNVSSVYVH